MTVGEGTVNTCTNVKTGKSITIDTAGSVTHTTLNPDGSQTVTSTGHNRLILFRGDEPEGPSTTHYVGRFLYTIPLHHHRGGVFVLDEESTTAQETDICAALS